MLTDDVKKYAKRSVLCWLATVSKDGMPNVSPKEIFTTEGDTHILIANIASPNSVRNIRSNPQVCVSFIDVFVQKGYKVKGVATLIHKTEAAYVQRVTPLKALAGEAFPIHTIIAVEVKEIQPIIAPRYRLYPKTTEQMQVEGALLTYGVGVEEQKVQL